MNNIKNVFRSIYNNFWKSVPTSSPPQDTIGSVDVNNMWEYTEPTKVQESETDDCCNIYVSSDILPAEDLNRLPHSRTALETPTSSKYEIDGATFTEKEIADHEDYMEFEVRKKRNKCYLKMQGNMDSNASDGESEIEQYESDSDEDYLNLSLERLKYGYVINDTIFLTEHQWHTIILTDVNVAMCALCEISVSFDEVTNHIDTEEHFINMDKYPPLKKFEFSIARKIKSRYHCGICNELFHPSSDHFSSISHESNLLYSINKLSDILHEESSNTDEVYHFKNHKMDDENPRWPDYLDNNDNYLHKRFYEDNIKFVDENKQYLDDFHDQHFVEYEDVCDTNNEFSYANMAKKETDVQDIIEIDLKNRIVKVGIDSYHMVTRIKGQNVFYCMACQIFDHISQKKAHTKHEDHLTTLSKCYVVEEYVDYYIRKAGNFYHCGQCNNIRLDIDEHLNRYHHRKHKLSTSEPSNDKGPDRAINDKTEQNLKPLNDYKNEKQVNDNARLINDNTQSNKKPLNDYKNEKQVNNNAKSINDTTELNKKPINDKRLDEKRLNDRGLSEKEINDITKLKGRPIVYTKGIPLNPPSTSTAPNLNQPNVVLLDIPKLLNTPIVIYPFGFKFTITCMAYNFIYKCDNGYQCVMCKVVCHEQFLGMHIGERCHAYMLMAIPFLPQYGTNLIRKVGHLFHCAVCNVYSSIYNDNIPQHIIGTTHLINLKVSLGIMINPNLDIRHPVVPSEVPKTEANDKQINDKPVNDKPVNDKPINDKLVNDKVAKPINEKQVNDNQEFNNTFDTTISDDIFDCDEYIFLKLNNCFYKVTNASYNTLVVVGNGSRFCFVCDVKIKWMEVQKHVDCRNHTMNVEKCLFVDKYGDNLLRQMFLTYHCCICNVLLPREEVTTHLQWSTHIYIYENISKLKKKQCKNKGDMKQIVVSTQKESIYLDGKPPAIQVLLNATIGTNAEKPTIPKDQPKPAASNLPKPTTNKTNLPKPTTVTTNLPKTATVNTNLPKQTTLNQPKTKEERLNFKKNKLIIQNGVAFVVAWQNWHGIAQTKKQDVYKCNLCQKDIHACAVDEHCASDWHNYALEKPFEVYESALIRKISEQSLNCVTCNTEVSSKPVMLQEHIIGKKHKAMYERIKTDTEKGSYSDCDEEVEYA